MAIQQKFLFYNQTQPTHEEKMKILRDEWFEEEQINYSPFDLQCVDIDTIDFAAAPSSMGISLASVVRK